MGPPPAPTRLLEALRLRYFGDPDHCGRWRRHQAPPHDPRASKPEPGGIPQTCASPSKVRPVPERRCHAVRIRCAGLSARLPAFRLDGDGRTGRLALPQRAVQAAGDGLGQMVEGGCARRSRSSPPPAGPVAAPAAPAPAGRRRAPPRAGQYGRPVRSSSGRSAETRGRCGPEAGHGAHPGFAAPRQSASASSRSASAAWHEARGRRRPAARAQR